MGSWPSRPSLIDPARCSGQGPIAVIHGPDPARLLTLALKFLGSWTLKHARADQWCAFSWLVSRQGWNEEPAGRRAVMLTGSLQSSSSSVREGHKPSCPEFRC